MQEGGNSQRDHLTATFCPNNQGTVLITNSPRSFSHGITVMTIPAAGIIKGNDSSDIKEDPDSISGRNALW
jgi:hypothetical protein